MKTCYIFGAAEGLPELFVFDRNDLIIAADAGINHLTKLKVRPDIALGDFDSLGFKPCCNEVIEHPVKKDDTDTLLAVKTGFERGFKRFVMYGCTGGRPDHTFANYQVLYYIASLGGRGYICGDGYVTTAITNETITFKDSAQGTLSVFSATAKSGGIYLKNLLYPLENATLMYNYPIGVSNEFIGKQAEVTVNNGTLLVFWSGSMNNLIESNI